MDFVINNYLIFIIIGVILLMALIGYIADNTNFEKKPKKPKKAKKGKQESIMETATDPSMAGTAGEQPVETPLENKTDEPINEDVTDSSNSLEEMPKEETPVSDNLMDAFEIPDVVSSENVDSKPVDEQVLEEKPIEEVTPVEGVSEKVSEPSEKANENDNKEEEKKASDDIWKF